MSDLSDSLDSFEADLTRIRELLNLVKSFRDFGSSEVPEELSSGVILWEEAMALKRAAPGLRTDLPLLSGSMVLYLCGRFEYFTRQLIEAMCDEIASRTAKFDELPQALKQELRKRTLEVAQTPTKFGFTHSEAEASLTLLVLGLHGNTSGSSLRIESKVLSVTESNMNSTTLAEILRRVGMKDVWREFGKQASLKIALDVESDSECTTAAQQRLDELMKERNQIAHPTSNTSFPDPDQVQKGADFLLSLGKVMVDLGQVHLLKFARDSRGS